MQYLGIDYGAKKIGLALGDDEVHIATPLEVFMYTDRAEVYSRIAALIAQDGIGAAVVGIPGAHNLSKQREEVEDFVEELKNHVSIAIHTYDESFSTTRAKQEMHTAGQQGHDDAHAAAVVLQAFLDRL